MNDLFEGLLLLYILALFILVGYRLDVELYKKQKCVFREIALGKFGRAIFARHSKYRPKIISAALYIEVTGYLFWLTAIVGVMIAFFIGSDSLQYKIYHYIYNAAFYCTIFLLLYFCAAMLINWAMTRKK